MEIVGNRRLRLSIRPTLNQVKDLLFYNLKSVVLFLLNRIYLESLILENKRFPISHGLIFCIDGFAEFGI